MSDLTLALFQPDIPQNAGTMLRACACLDYLDQLTIERHISWAAFEDWRAREGRRLVLLTTKGAQPYSRFAFAPGDILMVGRESLGAPDEVHEAADARLLIPLRPPARSLNVAFAAAMAMGEALRQIRRED